VLPLQSPTTRLASSPLHDALPISTVPLFGLYPPPRPLLSFPTRRSSDLPGEGHRVPPDRGYRGAGADPHLRGGGRSVRGLAPLAGKRGARDAALARQQRRRGSEPQSREDGERREVESNRQLSPVTRRAPRREQRVLQQLTPVGHRIQIGEGPKRRREIPHRVERAAQEQHREDRE